MDAVKDLSTAFQTSHDSLSITSTTAKASPSVDQIDNGSFDQSTSSPINEGRDESAIGPTDLSQAQLVGEQLCTMYMNICIYLNKLTPFRLLALLIKLKVFTKYLLYDKCTYVVVYAKTFVGSCHRGYYSFSTTSSPRFRTVHVY